MFACISIRPRFEDHSIRDRCHMSRMESNDTRYLSLGTQHACASCRNTSIKSLDDMLQWTTQHEPQFISRRLHNDLWHDASSNRPRSQPELRWAIQLPHFVLSIKRSARLYVYHVRYGLFTFASSAPCLRLSSAPFDY